MIQNARTVAELEKEKQNVNLTDIKTQQWKTQCTDKAKQTLEGIFTSDVFASTVKQIFTSAAIPSTIKSKDIYTTYTHNGKQRWGHVVHRGEYTFLQDFRSNKPPTNADIVNMSNIMKQVTSPRHV